MLVKELEHNQRAAHVLTLRISDKVGEERKGPGLIGHELGGHGSIGRRALRDTVGGYYEGVRRILGSEDDAHAVATLDVHGVGVNEQARAVTVKSRSRCPEAGPPSG